MASKKRTRPFATGSKPGPDAIDHYLEEQGFYRKHVARDPSSLFRVVAEHVLDVQEYHSQVRQDCAAFMENHSKDYSNEVDKNFYNYIASLRKLRTSGTLLELRVMARMYKKNVILFEPNQNNTQTSQRVYVQAEGNYEEPMRIFYSHKDKHFDVVYTMDFVEALAECQSIVYEILYVDVFKLPDVMYAVERMLHDQKGEITLPLSDDDTKYTTANGDIVPFGKAENSYCVLKDPETCHFHNQVNFDDIVKKNQDAIVIINRSDDPGHLKIFKPIDGYLYKTDISCVRQLLEENITPFPYKVAKALDPSIYRNTEFELWQETRKESRLKWRDIDDKFVMYGNDPRLQNHPYHVAPFDPTCMPPPLPASFLMDEPSLEKKFAYVTSKDNHDEKGGKFIDACFSGYDHKFDCIVPPREALEPIVMPMQNHYQPNNNNNYRPFRNNGGRRTFYNNNRYNRNGGGGDERGDRYYCNEQEQQQVFTQSPNSGYGDVGYQLVSYQDQISPPPLYTGPQTILQYVPTSPYQPVPMSYSQPNYSTAPLMQYPNYQVPPPTFDHPPPIIQSTTNAATTVKEENNGNGDCLNLIREGELNGNNIDINAKESMDPDGNDLPTNDVHTLQFFYNIGVRYFHATKADTSLENAVTSAMENLSVRQENEQQTSSQMNLETPRNDQLPPVPNNTPVAPRNSNYMQNNNRGSSQNYGGNYRENNNNRRYNNNHREHRDSYNGGGYNGKGRGGGYHNNNNNNNSNRFQFNSNVKNVHKAESNIQKTNSSTGSNFQNNSPTTVNGNHTAPNVVTQHSEISTTQHSTHDTKKTSSMITTTASTSSSQQMTSSPESAAGDAVGYASEQAPSRPSVVIPQTHVQIAPQTPQYYPVQAYAPPQQGQQQYTVCYAQNENGEYYQYQQPYQQPVYYAPQTPVYYQQPQQNYMNHSVYTNDSGVSDTAPYNGQPIYAQVYQPPNVWYPPPPTPQLMQQSSQVLQASQLIVQSPQIIPSNTTIPSYPIVATLSASPPNVTAVGEEQALTANNQANSETPAEA